MDKLYRELEKAHNKYLGCVGNMELKLVDNIMFSFGIEHIPSDGHCVINENTADVAPLSKCIEIIRKDGKLTAEIHKKYCI